MDMLHEATQYLERVRQTLLEADRFEDILPVQDAGELYRQYARQRRYGIDIQNIGAEIKLRGCALSVLSRLWRIDRLFAKTARRYMASRMPALGKLRDPIIVSQPRS